MTCVIKLMTLNREHWERVRFGLNRFNSTETSFKCEMEFEIERACEVGGYAGIIALAAIAEVLNHRIISLYPHSNKSVQGQAHAKAHNTDIVPLSRVGERNIYDSPPIIILWTSCNTHDMLPSRFIPNHFAAGIAATRQSWQALPPVEPFYLKPGEQGVTPGAPTFVSLMDDTEQGSTLEGEEALPPPSTAHAQLDMTSSIPGKRD